MRRDGGKVKVGNEMGGRQCLPNSHLYLPHLSATLNDGGHSTPLSEIWDMGLDQHQPLSYQTTIQLYFSTLSGPKPK